MFGFGAYISDNFSARVCELMYMRTRTERNYFAGIFCVEISKLYYVKRQIIYIELFLSDQARYH